MTLVVVGIVVERIVVGIVGVELVLEVVMVVDLLAVVTGDGMTAAAVVAEVEHY